MTSINKIDEFKEYLLEIGKNISIHLNKEEKDEDSERFENFDEIVDFAESNNVEITNVWKVHGDSNEYYEVNFIDLY